MVTNLVKGEKEIFMERRCNQRLLKTIKVMLYHKGIPVISCKTRDIGVEGIFVETGPLVYRNNTLLRIEFEVTLINSRQFYRLSAIVAHSSEIGLGLYILESESAAINAWCRVLQYDSSAISIDDPGENFLPVFV
ncbi:MAG: PilZ domain-containing protein [Gammaproteobacteria bacterium]